MQEIVFLKTNKPKWEKIEQKIKNVKDINPDELAELFINLTDDLSYARTFYPKSKVTVYLNGLTLKVHQKIYQKKRDKNERIIKFWTTELPLVVARHQKELLYSFLFFLISILIGVVSAANDDTFIRLILGDSYVNMTLENIEKGDPMAVYKSMHQIDMFWGITVNNILVSFYTFIFGTLFSAGTVFLLFSNGVMLGSFQYFFFQKGLLLQSVLVIWIHGTIEISSIVIAGGAGIILGNSILFPGTYSRLESFKRGAADGLKIVIGLIPLFITAGFLESFVTRHTNMPMWLSLFIIISSLIFILFYFVYYPIKLKKQMGVEND